MESRTTHVLTLKDIMSVQIEKSEVRPSTDVYQFVYHLSKTFNLMYVKDKDLETVEMGRKYLRSVYDEVVFKGRDFKEKLPKSDGITKDPRALNYTEADFQNCQQIDLTDERIWCYVIRGKEGSKTIRSEILSVQFQVDGKLVLRKVPVLTYKLFQACVSIILCLFNQHKGANPARIGANHVRACKIAAAAEDKDNWAIHTHSGMNFVAKYVYSVPMKKADGTDNQYYIPHLPPVEAFLMLAYKMDVMSARSLKKPKEECLFFLKSIFQTTQMPGTAVVQYRDRINAAEWGESFTGVAESFALAFSADMDKLLKQPPSKAAASSSQQGNSNAAPAPKIGLTFNDYSDV